MSKPINLLRAGAGNFEHTRSRFVEVMQILPSICKETSPVLNVAIPPFAPGESEGVLLKWVDCFCAPRTRYRRAFWR